MDRGEVDDELPLAAFRSQAVGTEHHFLHGRGIGEAHEDDAGRSGRLARMAGRLGAGLDQGGGLGGRAIPDRDVVTGVQQAPRHRKPHHPKAEIGELLRSPSVRPANPGHSHFSLIYRRKTASGEMPYHIFRPGPGHDKHAPVACLIV